MAPVNRITFSIQSNPIRASYFNRTITRGSTPNQYYWQTAPKVGLGDLITKEQRLGMLSPKKIASIISQKQISDKKIVEALQSKSNILTPKEFAGTISEKVMQLSDAARILSDESLKLATLKDVLKYLYIIDKKRFTQILLNTEMNKRKICEILYKEKYGELDKNLTPIIKDILNNEMSPYYATKLLSAYLRKNDFKEIFLPIQKKLLEAEKLSGQQKNLIFLLEKLSASFEKSKEEAKNQTIINQRFVLLKKIREIVFSLSPDEIAQAIRNPKYFNAAKIILEDTSIPDDKKAQIIASKNILSDEIAHLMSLVDSEKLASLLTRKDKKGKYFVDDDRLSTFLKDRHLKLRKAIEILSSDAFLERIEQFALNKNHIDNVLLNTLLYYMPADEAIRIINKNFRNLVELKDLLKYIFHPDLDSPCVQ